MLPFGLFAHLGMNRWGQVFVVVSKGSPMPSCISKPYIKFTPMKSSIKLYSVTFGLSIYST
jgi:hypothetical protein